MLSTPTCYGSLVTIEERLDRAGQEWAGQRKALKTKRQQLQTLAREAISAGVAETEIARRLGVDRMTVRQWLGKR